MGQPNLVNPEYKQAKKADLEMLEILQREGLIHLKYLVAPELVEGMNRDLD
jgi:hypothetical protein